MYGFSFVLVVLFLLSFWTLCHDFIPKWFSIPFLDPLYDFDFSVTNGMDDEVCRQKRKLLTETRQKRQFNALKNVTVRNRFSSQLL